MTLRSENTGGGALPRAALASAGPTAARVVPTVALIGIAWALAWAERGSIAASDWLSYAVLAALILATVLFSGAAIRPPRLSALGLAALAGLAVWAAVSIAWAPAPSLARDEALLTALYAIAFAVPLLTLRPGRDRLAALGAIAGAIAVLAVATGFKLRLSGSPIDLFQFGRLYFPITYANAQAALFLVGFWPAILLASRRSAPTAVRALALGGGVSMLAGWILAQSKGGGIGLAVSAIVVLAVAPTRLRLLVPTALAAAITGIGVRTLTAPIRTHTDAAFADTIQNGGVALLWLTAAGIAVGLGYALLDRRVHVSAERTRLAGRVVLAGLVVAIVAGVAAFFVTVHRPEHFIQDKWSAFRHLPKHETTSSHFLTIGSNRYDFWRVSVLEFREHPLLGVGARGFGPTYLQKGRSVETPARAHSLFFEVLGEDGLVGFLLLLGALGLPLAVVARRARSGDAAAVAALGAGVYWLTHAAVDWNWTVPAAGIPFFLLLGIGAGSDAEERPLARAAALGGAIASLVVAVFAFAPVWVSAKLTDRALDHPDSAASALRWAKRLDPLSTDPYVVQSSLATTKAGAIEPLQSAVRKEPEVSSLRYLLGLAYLDAGQAAAARRELERAHELAPRDPLVAQALTRARETS